MKVKVTQKFRDLVDERLEDVKGLEGLTYSELAAPLKEAKEFGSFFSPKYGNVVCFVEATLNGELYGIGFVEDNGVLVAKNVLKKGQVLFNRDASHVTYKETKWN